MAFLSSLELVLPDTIKKNRPTTLKIKVKPWIISSIWARTLSFSTPTPSSFNMNFVHLWVAYLYVGLIACLHTFIISYFHTFIHTYICVLIFFDTTAKSHKTKTSWLLPSMGTYHPYDGHPQTQGWSPTRRKYTRDLYYHGIHLGSHQLLHYIR